MKGPFTNYLVAAPRGVRRTDCPLNISNAPVLIARSVISKSYALLTSSMHTVALRGASGINLPEATSQGAKPRRTVQLSAFLEASREAFSRTATSRSETAVPADDSYELADVFSCPQQSSIYEYADVLSRQAAVVGNSSIRDTEVHESADVFSCPATNPAGKTYRSMSLQDISSTAAESEASHVLPLKDPEQAFYAKVVSDFSKAVLFTIPT